MTTGSKIIQEAREALYGDKAFLSRFMPRNQRLALFGCLHYEEGEIIARTVMDTVAKIKATPQTYQQDGLGEESVAHLHYFRGQADWWITEKDMYEDQYQAFGLASLYGLEQAELGYISIRGLVDNGVELNLYFEPKTLREIKEKK